MEALKYAKALKGSNRSNAFDAVFGQLASTNPSLAERQLSSINPRSMQRYALRALAAGIADTYPRQGIATLERNGASASDYAFQESKQVGAPRSQQCGELCRQPSSESETGSHDQWRSQRLGNKRSRRGPQLGTWIR